MARTTMNTNLAICTDIPDGAELENVATDTERAYGAGRQVGTHVVHVVDDMRYKDSVRCGDFAERTHNADCTDCEKRFCFVRGP